MRFAKLHPSFLVFFFLSLLSLGAALVLGLVATDACAGSDQSANSRCAIEAEGESTMAIVLAIGGLTAMLGGIGFQIGRARPEAPTVAPIPLTGAPAYPSVPPPGPQR